MKKRLIKVFHFFGMIFTTAIILLSSLLDGSTSSSQSRGVAKFINQIFNQFFLKQNSTMLKHKLYSQNLLINMPNNFELFLRKFVGHFSAFFILSYFATITFYFFKTKIKNVYLNSLLYGLSIALISELLQFIPLNRGPSMNDVLINYSGYISFIIIFSIVITINAYRNSNQNNNLRLIK